MNSPIAGLGFAYSTVPHLLHRRAIEPGEDGEGHEEEADGEEAEPEEGDEAEEAAVALSAGWAPASQVGYFQKAILKLNEMVKSWKKLGCVFHFFHTLFVLDIRA